MANVRNANTYYIDATGSLTLKNIKALFIIITATAANARLVLKDITTGATKMDVRITAADGQFFDFSSAPLVFPNGIDVTTVTNCIAVVTVEETRGG